MKQLNNTIPMSSPSRMWETPEAVEYNERAADIAAGQLDVSAIILHLTELPSRRWLIEASRP